MIGVCIVTYNQEMYIAEAIESVLMQEDCGQVVRIYVGNDCSKDNTQVICESYGNKITLINREHNLGLVVNTMDLLDKMRKDGCDYIAMLDGDDYWIDKQKLKKQMEYMRLHPEYGLVHTCVDLLTPKGIIRNKHEHRLQGDVSSIISSKYSISNCSVIFKTELLNYINFADFIHSGFMSVDYVMYCIFALHTQIGFIPDHTAIWRRGQVSVSNANDMEKQIKYLDNGIAMWKYLAKISPERWAYSEEAATAYVHTCSFNIAFQYQNRKRALREWNMMSNEAKRRNKLKFIVAHSVILMKLWHLLKEIKINYDTQYTF